MKKRLLLIGIAILLVSCGFLLFGDRHCLSIQLGPGFSAENIVYVVPIMQQEYDVMKTKISDAGESVSSWESLDDYSRFLSSKAALNYFFRHGDTIELFIPSGMYLIFSPFKGGGIYKLIIFDRSEKVNLGKSEFISQPIGRPPNP